MTGAKHPNAARLLLEFLLPAEGQAIYARNYVYPVRSDDTFGCGLAPQAG